MADDVYLKLEQAYPYHKRKEDIEKIGYPKRGDDIIISYLLKKYLNLKYLDTVAGKVLNLPEDDVGLNTDKEHYSMRWNVVEQFKKISD